MSIKVEGLFVIEGQNVCVSDITYGTYFSCT